MKLTQILLVFTLITLGCREKSSKEEITKPQIREQIQALQNPSADALESRISTLSDDTVQRLLMSPGFAPTMERILTDIKADLDVEVLELQKKSFLLQDIGIQARRKVKIKFNRRLIPVPVDPELSFRVVSRRKSFDCDSIESTKEFWQQFLSIIKEPRFRIITSKEWIEETIKTCLLFHRLKGNLSECGIDNLNELEQICQMGVNEDDSEE